MPHGGIRTGAVAYSEAAVFKDFQVSGSWFLVRGSWFLIPISYFLLIGSWFLVSGR